MLRYVTSNGLQGILMGSVSENLSQGGGAGIKRSSNKVKQPNHNKQATDEDEDIKLVQKAQTGDMHAFDQLVSKHRGKIYAMIRNMVKNDADAWDLSQDAFIKAWRALPKFESRARFSTWLFRISHNVVYDRLRKRRIEGDSELMMKFLMQGGLILVH